MDKTDTLLIRRKAARNELQRLRPCQKWRGLFLYGNWIALLAIIANLIISIIKRRKAHPEDE